MTPERDEQPALEALFGMTPPTPVVGCSGCAEFVDRRRSARAAHDYSKETDVNVLMRRHQRQAHPGETP
ncbi:hypothetical protein ABZX85_44060 [Streptomyces sp. NPDC004539]|uniref:hypothetical protein n=1 Tax=Streptomyces sp. NPDC004539 TaxID=3154280 RepID=UPI0033A0820A